MMAVHVFKSARAKKVEDVLRLKMCLAPCVYLRVRKRRVDGDDDNRATAIELAHAR